MYQVHDQQVGMVCACTYMNTDVHEKLILLQWGLHTVGEYRDSNSSWGVTYNL